MKKKLTKRKVSKGGNPVRESPIAYRIPEKDIWLKQKIETAMRFNNCSRSEIITQALKSYL